MFDRGLEANVYVTKVEKVEQDITSLKKVGRML